MNYLAHIFLSGDDPSLLFGNFIGDIITVKNFPKLGVQVKKGVRLHQSIDKFTDRHWATKEAIKIFKPNHGPYSPVIADIAFDYFLCKNWNFYSKLKYEEYCEEVYPKLRLLYHDNSNILPEYVLGMINSKWLNIYFNLSDLSRVYSRVERRVSKPIYFNDVIETIKENEVELNDLFMVLFPDLIRYSEGFIQEL